MMLVRRLILLACLSTLCVLEANSQAAGSQGTSKPKVRTIAAFVRVDAASYEGRVRDALTMLRNAQRAYELNSKAVKATDEMSQVANDMVR